MQFLRFFNENGRFLEKTANNSNIKRIDPNAGEKGAVVNLDSGLTSIVAMIPGLSTIKKRG